MLKPREKTFAIGGVTHVSSECAISRRKRKAGWRFAPAKITSGFWCRIQMTSLQSSMKTACRSTTAAISQKFLATNPRNWSACPAFRGSIRTIFPESGRLFQRPLINPERLEKWNIATTTRTGIGLIWKRLDTMLHDPAVKGIVLNIRDVTDRKEAEKALKESEERFRSFMKHFPGLAYIKDADGRVLLVNEKFAEYLASMSPGCWENAITISSRLTSRRRSPRMIARFCPPAKPSKLRKPSETGYGARASSRLPESEQRRCWQGLRSTSPR